MSARVARDDTVACGSSERRTYTTRQLVAVMMRTTHGGALDATNLTRGEGLGSVAPLARIHDKCRQVPTTPNRLNASCGNWIPFGDHPINLGRRKEDLHGICARMTRKFRAKDTIVGKGG